MGTQIAPTFQDLILLDTLLSQHLEHVENKSQQKEYKENVEDSRIRLLRKRYFDFETSGGRIRIL